MSLAHTCRPGCPRVDKISAALINLIDSYASNDLPLDRVRKVVGMGVIAWNIATTSSTVALVISVVSVASRHNDGQTALK